jgi:hypothetical protein
MLEIAAFATAVGHVTNVAKTLFDAHTQLERDAVRIEFTDAVLSLQSKQAEIQARYSQLLEAHEKVKQQLVAYERWEQESARYSLQGIVPGIFAYRLKPGDQSGEPNHWLCAACYKKHEPSILQESGLGTGIFECPLGHPPLNTKKPFYGV